MKDKKIIIIPILSLVICCAAISGVQAASASINSAVNTSSSLKASVGSSAVAANVSTGALTTLIDTTDLFTERDLEQTVDTTSAQKIVMSSGQNTTISEDGTYVISGSAENSSIIIDADKESKVQLVLDNLTIKNTSAPAIYVKKADKVFVNINGNNSLSVTGSFTADGDTNTDAVIFTKSDMVLNGTGSLEISSTDNGISGKDDIKITGGSYRITVNSDAVEAHDSIRISDGKFTINAGKDAFHSEYDENDEVGYIYICGGTFDITAKSDGFQGTTYTIIDGGIMNISAGEGIEATGVQINNGQITINSSDDGINAARKSSQFDPFIEVNGGTTTVNMAQGDTDAFDSNGTIIINGGTVDINGKSAFDYDYAGKINGGNVTINGTKVSEMTVSGPGGGGGNRGMGKNIRW